MWPSDSALSLITVPLSAAAASKTSGDVAAADKDRRRSCCRADNRNRRAGHRHRRPKLWRATRREHAAEPAVQPPLALVSMILQQTKAARECKSFVVQNAYLRLVKNQQGVQSVIMELLQNCDNGGLCPFSGSNFRIFSWSLWQKAAIWVYSDGTICDLF